MLTWYKKDFGFIDREDILKLIEKHGALGYFVLDCIYSILGKEKSCSITKDSSKYNIFLKKIKVYTDLDFDKIQEIIDTLLELNFLILNDSDIICLELKEIMDEYNHLVDIRKQAGKKGAMNKKELNKNSQKFSKMDIEGYSETFDDVPTENKGDIILPEEQKQLPERMDKSVKDRRHEIKQNKIKMDNEDTQKIYDVFRDCCQRYFNKIPEKPFTNRLNRQEQKALNLILNFIDDGYLFKFCDYSDYLDRTCQKISKGNESFVFTNLYKDIVKECLDARNYARTDIVIDWMEEVTEKYTVFEEMP